MLDPNPTSTDAQADLGDGEDVTVHAEDVLVEDVSIDGMCGVY